MSKAYRVNGMSCEGCVRSVSSAIRARLPAAAVEVDLDHGLVRVDGVDDDQQVMQAVDDAGFDYQGPVT